MRIKHDEVCLWWKDWHSCSCGYLEEEIRNEKKHSVQECIAYQEGSGCEGCLDIIPGTFIACGEGVGNERQYCSDYCYKKSKGE